MTVTVTFLDSSTVWFEIEAEVLSRVPLCGITWLQHNRVQRLLDSINISFVPYKPDMFPRAVPGTATPFAVHLYLVNCDDPDLYKTSVKKQLSDWLAVIGAKKNQEPLIVYLGAPDANRKQAPSRLFGGSVADRIKSDFAKTNMIHLKPSHPKDVSIWNEFFAKLRELILASFNGKLLQYDEDTRRLDAQRLLPGWNYCQFFILKDGAACTYEFLNVHGEALMQYDELEAAFFQNLQEQGAPWFQSFGGSETGDDSHDILNVSRKPYRDLILQNTISIFDFRIYLFARQIQLLIKSPNGVVEACVRAKKFITSFARTLQEYSVGLVPYFTESWVYTACMSVIRHCDENIAESNASATAIPTSELNAYEGVKAELLHYARMQLDILGSASDLFTSSIHKVKTEVNAMMEHSTGNDGSPEEKKFPRETVSNKELKDALETAEAFDSLYLSISNRAVKGFEASQRKRTALLVKGDIASLYFHRAQYSEASAIWEQITTQFGGKGWESMDEAVLEKLVICQKELGRFGPLVDACLRLLATDSVKDTEKYVDFINGAAHDLKAEKNANGPTFAEPRFLKVNAVKFVNRIGNEDAHALELQIDNYLSKALKVQKVTSILAGKESAGLTCNVDDVLLNPGSNIVRLWCEKVSLAGMYVVESVKLGVGHALLEYGFPKSGVRKRSFHVFEQAEAMLLSVKVLPSEVTMAPHLYRRGVTRLFQVELSNPMKPIQSASVSAIPITSAVIPTITTATIQIKDNQTQTVIRQEDTPVKDRQISIPAFSTNETVTFTLPLTLNDSDVDFVSVKFVIVFTTASGSSMDEGGKEGTLSKTLDISAVPPLKISHTLIPRGSGILLQVLVVGGSSVPLRIDGVRLHGLKGFKVLDYSQWGDSLVFEGQTHSLVYLLEHSDSAFPRHGQKAKVVIKYHSTVDEIQHHISQRLESYLRPLHKEKYSQFLSRQCISILNLEANKYSLCGRLPFPAAANNLDLLRKSMETEDEEVINDVTNLFTNFLQEMGALDVKDVKQSGFVGETSQRVVEHGFETADYQIVLSADVKPKNIKGSRIVAGSVLPCTVTIADTFWGADSDSIDAVYTITVNETNWVLAGHKRHKFRFKKGETVDFQFELVSVGAGKLLLPSVKVEALKTECGVYCVYPSSEEVLVQPADSKSLIIHLD